MKEDIIKTNLLYSVILLVFVSPILFVGLIICILFIFGMPNSVVGYLIVSFFVLFSIICFVTGLHNYQKAILSEKGIQLKSGFGKIVNIEWDEIKKIDIQDLKTLYSNFKTLNYKWIVITTNIIQKPKEGGANGKKPPWTIKATEKNITIIKNWAMKFAKDAIINL